MKVFPAEQDSEFRKEKLVSCLCFPLNSEH